MEYGFNGFLILKWCKGLGHLRHHLDVSYQSPHCGTSRQVFGWIADDCSRYNWDTLAFCIDCMEDLRPTQPLRFAQRPKPRTVCTFFSRLCQALNCNISPRGLMNNMLACAGYCITSSMCLQTAHRAAPLILVCGTCGYISSTEQKTEQEEFSCFFP